MLDDFSETSGGPEAPFLQVLDALHVAAAGDSPLMVEYLLTHSRVCLEKMRHADMMRIKEVRKREGGFIIHGVH